MKNRHLNVCLVACLAVVIAIIVSMPSRADAMARREQKDTAAKEAEPVVEEKTRIEATTSVDAQPVPEESETPPPPPPQPSTVQADSLLGRFSNFINRFRGEWLYTDCDGDGYFVRACNTMRTRGPCVAGGDFGGCVLSAKPDPFIEDCAPNDSAVPFSVYVDADGDGYPLQSEILEHQCSIPNGYVALRSDGEWDCDDQDNLANPGAQDICGDNKDNNCNAWVDEGCQDYDGDRYYKPLGNCMQVDPADPSGSLIPCGDCVDYRPSDYPAGHHCAQNPCWDGSVGSCNDAQCFNCYWCVNPGRPELPADGIDNNCDGEFDEVDPDTDLDGDGFSYNQGDMNDNDNTIYPGAPELCDDGKDNDLNGLVDFCDTAVCPIVDNDGDGFPNEIDCKPDDADIHPDCNVLAACIRPADCQNVNEGCGDTEDLNCDGVREAYTEQCALCVKIDERSGEALYQWQGPSGIEINTTCPDGKRCEMAYGPTSILPTVVNRIKVRFKTPSGGLTPWNHLLPNPPNLYNRTLKGPDSCYKLFFDEYKGNAEIGCGAPSACDGKPAYCSSDDKFSGYNVHKMRDWARLTRQFDKQTNTPDFSQLPTPAQYKNMSDDQIEALLDTHLNTSVCWLSAEGLTRDASGVGHDVCDLFPTGLGAISDAMGHDQCAGDYDVPCDKNLILKERYCENPASTRIRTALINCANVGLNRPATNEVGICTHEHKCARTTAMTLTSEEYTECVESETGACGGAQCYDKISEVP